MSYWQTMKIQRNGKCQNVERYAMSCIMSSKMPQMPKTLCFNGHFSWWTQYQNVPIPDLIGAKDDRDGGRNWIFKTHKAPVKSSPPTNQHSTFYRPDALPVAQSTVSEHLREMPKTVCSKNKTKASWVSKVKAWNQTNRSISLDTRGITIKISRKARNHKVAFTQQNKQTLTLFCLSDRVRCCSISADSQITGWRTTWWRGLCDGTLLTRSTGSWHGSGWMIYAQCFCYIPTAICST